MDMWQSIPKPFGTQEKGLVFLKKTRFQNLGVLDEWHILTHKQNQHIFEGSEKDIKNESK